eukprot:4695481-Amphidinium_carterae.1
MSPESKYVHIIQAAETAAREIRASRKVIPQNAPHLDRHLALHALQALWKHDLHKTRSIILRAPHWKIKESSNVAVLRRQVSAIVDAATTKIIEGEIDAIGSQHVDVPRRQILNKLLAMWRTKRVTPSHFEIVNEAQEPCDEETQFQLVREHWRSVFQHAGMNDARAQSVLLRYEPDVPWPSLTTRSTEEIEHVIKGCPDTSPGPDRLTFVMMRLCAATLAPWLRDMLLHLLRGEYLDGGFTDSMFAFIAKPVKDQRSSRWRKPEELRPLTLYNTCWKVLQKLVTYRLQQNLPQWISPQQYGFVQGRYIHNLACEVEHSSMVLGAHSPEASTTL